jgi:hypothetical protein
VALAGGTACNDDCGCIEDPVEPTGCCDAHGTPGCDNAACEVAVCSVDAFCCDSAWDALCVDLAIGLCGPTCDTPVLCPGTGDCCGEHASTGCADMACCSTVCAADAFCCTVTWDAQCAASAFVSCADLCNPPPPSCPFDGGDCCAANGTNGCDDVACCETVCAADPFCCDGGWDGECVEAAAALCSTVDCIGDACGGPGACNVAHGGIGCSDATCCATVCAADFFCCQVSWDEVCVDEAVALCGIALPVCPGGGGDCFGANGSPGCDDVACCESVCAVDAFCCDTTWDTLCVSAAVELCPLPPVCPGEGDCCADNGTVGCADAACCETVCADDPFCCEATWDGVCAELAQDLCGALCPTELACPGTGDCCGTNDTPGCVDTACCLSVCGDDPFCCEVTWDGSCAAAADTTCDVCINAAPDSCAGSCDDQAPDGCWCDSLCVTAGDCCADACGLCGACP